MKLIMCTAWNNLPDILLLFKLWWKIYVRTANLIKERVRFSTQTIFLLRTKKYTILLFDDDDERQVFAMHGLEMSI